MSTLPASTEARRSRLVTALFARATGNDRYLAQQIQEAIAFSLAELEQQERDSPDFAARYDAAFISAAVRLMEAHFRHAPGQGFFHWDAARTQSSATLLFARAELMEGLKRLSACTESTLLITNLRPALIPPGVRATQKRERDYEELLLFVSDLAAARTPAHAKLQVLFL